MLRGPCLISGSPSGETWRGEAHAREGIDAMTDAAQMSDGPTDAEMSIRPYCSGDAKGHNSCCYRIFGDVSCIYPKCLRGVWRETQGGWTVAIAEGVSANIRVTRKGKAAWTMILSGTEDTVAEAQAKLETLAAKIALDGGR